MSSPSSLDTLIEALRCLPGVGPKSATRMAYHLLQRDQRGAARLATALASRGGRLGVAVDSAEGIERGGGVVGGDDDFGKDLDDLFRRCGPLGPAFARSAASITDGLLAATGIEYKLTIVTRNISDFQRSGVVTLNPSLPPLTSISVEVDLNPQD